MSSIQNFSDFVTTIQNVLTNCELRSNDPFNDPTVWRATQRISNNDFFVIKKDAGHDYFLGLNYVREQLQSRNLKFSEIFVENSYFRFIENQLRNNGNLNTECQRWLDSLYTLQPKNYKFLIPVNHYEYRGDIDLGNVKIVKLNDQILQQHFGIGVGDPFTSVADLRQHNQTDIFAIVYVDALEEDHAKESAHQLAERFVYATKLIDPGSYVRLRKRGLSLINEQVLSQVDGNTSVSMHSYNIPVRITPPASFYLNLQPYWLKLSGFLYAPQPNDLQEAILSSLYWIGEADTLIDSRVKLYLNLMTGLEWIVLHNHNQPLGKADKFGRNCAIIFSGDARHWEFWRNYYWKRNDINHQKLVDVYKEEIDTLLINLRFLLLKLIDFTGTYNRLEDVFQNEYGIT